MILLPHEIAHRFVIPVVRATLSRMLSQDYKMKQDEIAKRLHITQAAVSNYSRGKRAHPLMISLDEQASTMINRLAADIAKTPVQKAELLRRLTGICDYVLKAGLVCDLHSKLEPDIDKDMCSACKALATVSPPLPCVAGR